MIFDKLFNTLRAISIKDGKSLRYLETYRRQVLDATALAFIFGIIVGLLSPFYLAVSRFTLLYLFLSALPFFLLETSAYFASAILCMICYLNLKEGRLKLASIRGVIAAGLLVVTGTWLAGLLVFGAAITCSLYQEV